MSNTFGTLFRLTSFGESHGLAIGGIIDGMPSGIDIDLDLVQHELSRRRPGQNKFVSSRNEVDKVELLSGVFEGKSTGTPIGFIVKNINQQPKDYDKLRDVLRPSHADFTYLHKYGLRDHRGGGRSSARITIARCVGGALAKQALAALGIDIKAYACQIGGVRLEKHYSDYDLNHIDDNAVRCPDLEKAKEMEQLICDTKSKGDTLGGVIECVIKGCPIGLGEPEFNKLHAQLGAAMLGINAAKGFEYGMGFEGIARKGSEVNDVFINEKGSISTRTNFSGGIQGGISNGQDIYFRVAFKPVATLLQEQDTVDVNGNPTTIHVKGRHDTCAIPRAVPVVEAMAAMVILDNYLLRKTNRL